MNALNLWLFELIHGFAGQSPFLDEAGVFFAQYVPYLVGILFLVFLVRHAKDWRVRIVVFADAAIAILLARGIVVEALRLLFPISRPFAVLGFDALIPEFSNAFPSAHAAVFFALAMTAMFYSKKHGWWFLLFALVNGIARIFVGVHWPLDIISGALVGIGGAIVAHALLKPYLSLLQRARVAH